MSLATLLIAATRFLVGGRAVWNGARPTPAQRIYFANHGSHMDTLVLWAALPAALRARTRPVAAADYWGAGRLRRFLALEVLGAVLIERGGGAEALDPLKEALEAGDSLILFPEGTRATGLLPGPFRAGLHHLAQAFPQVELVPVYLDNLNRALPKGTWLPVPVTAAAIFGPPLRARPGEARDAFLARTRDAVIALARAVHPEAAAPADA